MSELRKVKIKEDFSKEKIGFFHQWGTISSSADNGSYFPVTVAIIELMDGSVTTAQPYQVQFMDLVVT